MALNLSLLNLPDHYFNCKPLSSKHIKNGHTETILKSYFVIFCFSCVEWFPFRDGMRSAGRGGVIPLFLKRSLTETRRGEAE